MGISKTGLLIVAAAMFTGLAAAAHAAPSFMLTAGATTQPVGHYEFCQRLPAECREMTPDERPVELTRALWALMIDINNKVNTTVEPKTDRDIWGVEERWSYPERYGDCEDYVLAKRRMLIEQGIPAGNVLITVVRQQNGEGHAVLTVNTSMGDFVLDNLEPRILLWSATGYRFLKRQSTTNSGVWMAIDDSPAVAVGSVSRY